MKRFVKWLIFTLLAFAVVFLGGAYVLPGEAVVQRQIVIAASPEKIFPLINDLKRMNEWSPWAEFDPAAIYTFEGAGPGIGQKMSWSSNKPEVGKGSLTIVESVPDRRVATALDFGDGGTGRASIELSPVDGGTGVTWGFKSELHNPFERWLGLMFDKWIGDDYAKGLAKLKAVAEKPA